MSQTIIGITVEVVTKHSRDSNEECREEAQAGPMANAVESPSNACITNVVKVFSATKSRDREALGNRVTAWLRAHPAIQIARANAALSSDYSFHCLSIVLFGHSAEVT